MRRTTAALLGAGLLVGVSVLLRPQDATVTEPAAVEHRPTLRSETRAAPAPLPPPETTWIADEVMLAVDRETLEALADEHAAAILRPVGISGYGVLSVPEGLDRATFLAALRSDPRVGHTIQPARIHGASRSLADLQWHHDSANTPPGPAGDLSRVVVAILDTGVAYADHSDDSGDYVAAPSLSGSDIVAPWDFVNGDGLALDDHQHGTHVASIIASDGDVVGVAPGASLMPLKILDAENTGSEADLVEAIYWATDNGADIINMSLTFGEGYVPSVAISDALQYAADAGVVMVGAAGNDALDEVGYPAASPVVIAVGSSCPQKKNNLKSLAHSDYTNVGVAMDVMAPGGCIDVDLTQDGHPDGILAETIAPGDPARVGHWFMAGSSQATAVVSGGLAHLLAGGVTPEEVALYLQKGASVSRFSADSFFDGYGAGAVDLDRALTESLDPLDKKYTSRAYYVALMPYLVDNGDGTVTPTATFTVLGHDLEPVANATMLLGQLHGSSEAHFRCKNLSDTDGMCTVSGPPVEADEVLAWRFTVDAVVRGNIAFRPEVILFAQDDLEAVTAAIQDSEGLGAVLGLYWPAGSVEGLGDLAESYAVLNAGTGIATSPMGVLVTPRVLEDVGEVTELSLGGEGIATSPFGARRIVIDGTGIATSPFSFTGLTLVMIDGTGIATSPFGGQKVYTGIGVDSDGEQFSGEPILMRTGEIVGADATGTALQAQLDAGGWLTPDGYEAASLLSGTGVVETTAESTGSGAGSGSTEL